jgi:fructan beta-fructosidase
MVLNERDGHSIYTSPNLKDWKYESHTTGFWECPELFELPVDGNPGNTRWVMYGASGTYMLGDFDGKQFKPTAGEYYYTNGGLYAAQTINNIPASDGRRIQIGWGRLPTPGYNPAFNNLMTIPTELTLRNTKDGIRLASKPVKEFDRLTDKTYEWKNLTSAQADEKMKQFAGADVLRIQTTLKLYDALSAGVSLNGQNLLDYDIHFTRVNGVFYSPQEPASMEITADIIIDRTAIEVFIDGGLYSFSMLRDFSPEKKDGFHFRGNHVEVKELKVSTLKSIW